jgi:hypothetical protein
MPLWNRPVWDRYIRAFHKELDKWAVWQPGSPADVCDYGVIDHGKWTKLGSLWDLLERTEKDVIKETPPANLMFGSASASAIDAGVNTPAVVGASVQLTFSNQNSFYVRAYQSTERSHQNLQNLGERLLKLEKNWRKEWYLVVGVRTAARFSVLASSEAGGEIKVTAPLPELQSFLLGAANASASLQIAGSVGFSFIGKSGPIHLDLVRVRWSPLRGKEVHSLGSDPTAQEELLEPVTPSEFYQEDEADGR